MPVGNRARHAALLFPLLTAATANPATEVCGTLKLPQEWTAKKSPFLVTGDVVVPATSQLRIGPGVEVVFARRSRPCAEEGSAPAGKGRVEAALIGISVEGAFYCLGEPGKPVIFRPASGGGVGWRGISLTGQPQSAVEIGYAEFRGANRAVRAEKAAFAVHHVLFEENNVGLWLGPGGDLAVLHCIFARNRGAGLRIDQSAPKVVNNVFYGNRAYGVWIGEGGALTIAYNDFFGNGEEACFHCPYAVLRPAARNRNGDSVDAFFNLSVDPVFEGSASHKARLHADPEVDTPPHLVKDRRLAELERDSRAKFRKKIAKEASPFAPRGEGPYVLSRYSKLIRAGHSAKSLRNPDGTPGDIGLHGGPKGRIPENSF